MNSKLVEPGLGQGRSQGLVDLVDGERAALVGRVVVPAAHPSGAVVGEDQRVFFCRVIGDGPGHEFGQRLRGAAVHLPQIPHHFRVNGAEIVVLSHQKTFGALPVTVAGEGAVVAVELGDDGDFVGGAYQLGFVQIGEDVAFQHLIVGVLVEHDQPVALCGGFSLGRWEGKGGGKCGPGRRCGEHERCGGCKPDKLLKLFS